MNLGKRSCRRPWLAYAACLAVACESTGARDRQTTDPTSATASPPAAARTHEPPKPPEPGTLPSAPLTVGSEVELPSVRVNVVDFARGNMAWRALRAASSANPPAPSGRQYALVRVRVTGVAPMSWVGCKQFRIVGVKRIVYAHAGQLPPEPPLPSEALQAGQTLDGWCTYSIQSSDRGLILMIDDPDFRHSAALRYVALETGASLARIASTESDEAALAIGRSALSPAALGSEVVTQNWWVKVVDVVRGADAQHLVESANSSNGPPADGLEFVAVKIHARYHGRPGQPGLLSTSEFRVVGRDGEPYDAPIVLDVTPRLTRTLFPGGEHTGWAVFQIDPTDLEAVLRFTPYFPDLEVRYLALAKSGVKVWPSLEGASVISGDDATYARRSGETSAPAVRWPAGEQ